MSQDGGYVITKVSPALHVWLSLVDDRGFTYAEADAWIEEHTEVGPDGLLRFVLPEDAGDEEEAR